MKFFFSIIVFALTISIGLAQLTNSTNFESQVKGTAYIRSIWQSDGFTTDTWDNRLSTTMIDDSYAVSGTKSLRITYPQGGFGPDQSGCQIPLLLPSANQYYMSYWLRFSDNFAWGTSSEGGKLPGLAGGDRCSGGASCDGTNGFSARFMWRTGGKAVLYLYHMDKPEVYGEDIDLIYPWGDDVIFEKGKWYHMMERVKINTNGTTYDGEVEVWVNGKPVLLRTGLRFTSNGDKVDNLYISTFHGGSDATWAPTVTCYTWIDDIKISPNKSDVDFLSCNGPKIGPDKSLCGVNSVVLDANIISPNCTYNWYNNGVNIGTNKTYTATSTGEYIVVYDSSGCVQKDTVIVKNIITPNLGNDKEICTNSFELLDANEEGPSHIFSWKKDGILLPYATQRTLAVSKAGLYQVTVSATGCATASDDISLTSNLLTVTEDSICPSETASIAVNQNGTFNWYATATSSLILQTGTTFTSTENSANTYFVQDVNGFTGLVGKFKPITPNYTDNRFDRNMMFTTFKSLSIDSITIYPATTQNVTIRILASNMTTVLFTKTFNNLAAGEQRIPLFAALTAGSYYMDAVGTTGSLRHSYENDTNIHFPYTIDGVISITGSNLAWINAKPYYLFFYNWRISTGNTCARTPVEIYLKNNCSTTLIQENKKDHFTIYPNPANLKLNIETSEAQQIIITNTLGQTVYASIIPNLNSLQIDISQFKSGIYFVKIGEKVHKFIKE